MRVLGIWTGRIQEAPDFVATIRFIPKLIGNGTAENAGLRFTGYSTWGLCRKFPKLVSHFATPKHEVP